jgi:hypothetical protein
MNITIPQLPPIISGQSIESWARFYAFYNLSLDAKGMIVNEHPNLIIERPIPLGTSGKGAPRSKVYFDPGVFDTQISSEEIYRFYGHITMSDKPYPKQSCPADTFTVGMSEDMKKSKLFDWLETVNAVVLAYKYRYVIRPEEFSSVMDYSSVLVRVTTVEELLTFYEL